MESQGPLFDGESSKTQETDAYKKRIYSHLPIYSTKLVREAEFTFPERSQVRTPEDVAALLVDYYREHDKEEFIVLLLDTANTIIGMVQSSIGGLAASIVEPRQVFKAAILGNAAAVIVAHNHPSGNIEPSREDIRVTRQLVEVGKIMGIPVHDHVIIAETQFTSLAERGLLA